MKRLLFVAVITLLVALGCDRGGNTGTPPRSSGEPGTKEKDRRPTSDSGPADGAPGSNRGGERKP